MAGCLFGFCAYYYNGDPAFAFGRCFCNYGWLGVACNECDPYSSNVCASFATCVAINRRDINDTPIGPLVPHYCECDEVILVDTCERACVCARGNGKG